MEGEGGERKRGGGEMEGEYGDKKLGRTEREKSKNKIIIV